MKPTYCAPHDLSISQLSLQRGRRSVQTCVSTKTKYTPSHVLDPIKRTVESASKAWLGLGLGLELGLGLGLGLELGLASPGPQP